MGCERVAIREAVAHGLFVRFLIQLQSKCLLEFPPEAAWSGGPIVTFRHEDFQFSGMTLSIFLERHRRQCDFKRHVAFTAAICQLGCERNSSGVHRLFERAL